MSNENPTPLGGSMIMAAIWFLLAGAVSIFFVSSEVLQAAWIVVGLWLVLSTGAGFFAWRGAQTAQADEMHRAGTQAGLIVLGLMAFMPNSGDLAYAVQLYLMSIASVMLWTYVSHFRAAGQRRCKEETENEPPT